MNQDAIAMLDADHQRVEALFRDYQSAGDQTQKADIAQVICLELTLHTTLEEELFYPAFEQATQEKGLMQEAQKEHQEAKQLIQQIQQSPTQAEALVKQLQQAIEHHVQDEREKVFPKAKASGMDLAGMAQQMESRKAQLAGTMHAA